MALVTSLTRTLRRSLLLGALLLFLLAATPAQAQFIDGPWPRFGHDAQNTHQSLYGEARSTFTANPWIQGGAELTWPTLSATDSLYIIAPGLDDVAGTQLYSISAETGQQGFWSLNLESRALSFGSSVRRVSPPAIDNDGVLYLAVEWEPDDFAGEVLAFDPTTFFGGEVLWRYLVPRSFEENDHPTSGAAAAAWHAPVLSQDSVMFVHVDHQLFAFEMNPDVRPEVDPLWDVDGGPFECLNLGPDGTLYARSGDVIYAVNPEDGGTENVFDLEGTPVQNGCPAIAPDGTIYATTQAAVHAFAPDGQELWSYFPDGDEDPHPATPPMVGPDGTLYYGGYRFESEPVLVARHPDDGAVAWTFEPGWVSGVPAPMVNAPSLAPDGSVMFVLSGEDGIESMESRLFAVDSETGSVLWSYEESRFSFVSPAVFNSAGSFYLIDHGLFFNSRTLQAYDLPGLSAAPTAIDFGSVIASVGATETLALHNNRDDEVVEGISVAVTGPDSEFFDATALFDQIGAGASEEIEVTFDPDEGRAYEATLEISTASMGTYYVALSGEGEAAEIVLSSAPPSVDFGVVAPGDSASATVTLSNDGNVDVHIFDTDVWPSENGEGIFYIEAGAVFEGLVLEPGQEHVLSLGFAPPEPGSFEAELIVGYGAEEMLVVPIFGDGERPVITVTEPDVSVGEDATLQIEIENAGLEALEGVLYFRRGGEPNFETIGLTGSEGSFTATIPGSFVTARGVDYFLTFSSPSLQLLIYYPEDGPSAMAHLRVRVPPAPAEGVFAADTYRMVSVPMEVADPSATAVLGPSYGSPDDYVWRLLRWHQASNRYRDARNDGLEIQPGKAFWLITRSGDSFAVEDGTSTPASEPFALSLEPGWNQLGNPFAFPIDWFMTFPENESDFEVVEPPVFFDGTAYVFDQTVLEPWEGAFVFNSSSNPVTIYIPPIDAEASEGSEGTFVRHHEPPTAYTARLRASFPDGESVSDQGMVGFLSEDAEGGQTLRRNKPPAINEKVRVQIMDEEGILARSFERPDGDGAIWDVEVSRSAELQGQATPARFQILEEGTRPAGYSLHVIDDDTKRPMRMEGGGFAFTFGDQQTVRRFRVLVGTDEFVQKEHAEMLGDADRFDLLPGYPNPFSSLVHIPYSLAEGRDVRIDVYNPLGQRITTLVDARQEAGFHEVVWDGRTASGRFSGSGTYYVRIRAGDFVKVRSLVLVR